MAVRQGTDLRDTAIKIGLGALSCMLPLPLLNPLEVIKIRLQLQGELANEKSVSASERIYGSDRRYKGTLRGALKIVQQERLSGLYKGFLPALMREAIYAGFRMGTYDTFKQAVGANEKGELVLWKKIVSGATVGLVGAFIATPTDVVKVRMQGDTAPPGTPPRYRSTWHAFGSILSEEGIRGMWKGVGPTCFRAAIISAAMMPSYDHSKYLLLKHKWFANNNIYAQFTSAMIAGFLMTVVSSPIDVIKTRVVNATAAGGPYVSPVDCMKKTLAAEGLLGLYKGFLPAYMRLGPHTLMAFLTFEKLRSLVGYKPV